ncbi:FGGY family carbohydrate kinase [Sciscionella marina]|uniref:FGGY family carbohydrate kinase n=1 Tax=Sciscionella marina TaxID=508770 RepID=UPI0003799CCA|nr:FGGY family carbohydrate kinase [Sciscionella marina]
MGPARYLGVDIGTTATKAIAFDAAGSALGSARSGYQIDRPGQGRAEQDPRIWLRAVDDCVAELAVNLDLGTVAGIGVTGQVNTHLLLDEHREPLRPALLWQDVRAAAEAAELDLDASSPVPRARWLARAEPEHWAGARWLLLPKDYVNAWLTGVVGSDPLASVKITDTAGGYLPVVDRAAGLRERLPPLCAPHEPLGELRADWHGIPAGANVATGTMDAYCDVLGAGLSAPGTGFVILGTTAVAGALGTRQTSTDPVGVPGLVTFPPYRGRVVHAGPTQSGGDSLRWWARASGHSAEDVLAAAEQAEPGSGGVVFAPHLLGERAPLWDSEVRAWFTGVHAGTGFAELSRAVLEGVAYSVRDILDVVRAVTPVGELALCGGGTRSPLWRRILADVTQSRMRRVDTADTSVHGAGTLAAAAHQGADPWERAAGFGRAGAVLEPDPGPAERYGELFAVYRETYEALRGVHARMAR